MSYWAKFGLTISNLEVFRNMCERYQIEYSENQDQNFRFNGEKVVALLRDKNAPFGTRYNALLVESGGGIKMAWDTHTRYNPLAQRIGANGGKLTRDYSTEMIKKNVRLTGGAVTATKENLDGSITIRAAMGGGM